MIMEMLHFQVALKVSFGYISISVIRHLPINFTINAIRKENLPYLQTQLGVLADLVCLDLRLLLAENLFNSRQGSIALSLSFHPPIVLI